MKKHRLIICAFLILSLLCPLWCGFPGEANQTGWREVLAPTGEKIRISQFPRNVLSLSTTATDTILRIGGEKLLKGIDEYSLVVPGANNLPVLAKGDTISKEQVLVRKIDLAFIWWYQNNAATILKSMNIPVVKIRCNRANEVPDTIKLIGFCLGLTNAANELASNIEKEVATQKIDGDKRARVYIELYSAFKTGGCDTYINDLIEFSGGDNVAKKAKGYVLFSSEELISADPEIVILIEGYGTPEQFTKRGGLNTISAIKNNQIYVVPRYLFVPCANISESISILKKYMKKVN